MLLKLAKQVYAADFIPFDFVIPTWLWKLGKPSPGVHKFWV